MTQSRRRPSMFRAHPWLSTLGTIAGLIVFLAVVPVVPFMPSCQPKLGDSEDWGIVFGWMIPEYRKLLTEGFDHMGVYHWEFGPIVLVRALPWLDGRDSFDQTDGIANAESKAAWYLARGSYDGEVIVDRVYYVPDHVKALRDPVTDDYDRASCEFRRAVILEDSQ